MLSVEYTLCAVMLVWSFLVLMTTFHYIKNTNVRYYYQFITHYCRSYYQCGAGVYCASSLLIRMLVPAGCYMLYYYNLLIFILQHSLLRPNTLLKLYRIRLPVPAFIPSRRGLSPSFTSTHHRSIDILSLIHLFHSSSHTHPTYYHSKPRTTPKNNEYRRR